jgi:hypothetical protein
LEGCCAARARACEHRGDDGVGDGAKGHRGFTRFWWRWPHLRRSG